MNGRAKSCFLALLSICLLGLSAHAQEATPPDKDLAKDLELLQGSWQMLHVRDEKGQPTLRSVKTVEGTKETLRRFEIKTGKEIHKHSVEFKLSKSGPVRVFTFFPVGGTPEQGASFVYKVDADNFWDVPGLLQGTEYRNYQGIPIVWRWRRIKGDGLEKKSNKKEVAAVSGNNRG